MTDYLTEQEQVEIIKKWLKQYSGVILMGIVAAIVIVTGWRYWQQREYKNLTQASMVYDEMLAARAQNIRENTNMQSNTLTHQYPKTVYGQMANLTLARDAALNRDFSQAKNKLNNVLQTCKDGAICQIARLRLGRIYLAQNLPKEALETLAKIEDKTFNGLILELKGDAYLKLKDIDKARASYQQALAELPNADRTRPLLRMKFENLTV